MCRVLFCLQPQPDRVEGLCNHAIDDKAVCIEKGSHATGIGSCERAIMATPSPLRPLPCFGKASRTATIIGVYINGSSEKAEKLE